jgi:hypothetical protein
MLAAALLRLRVFGGVEAGGGAAGTSCCCCCSSTFARFLRDRLFESGVPAAPTASCSGLGSRAAAAFLFLELVVMFGVVADGVGFDGESWVIGFWFPAESLAAERVTLDDMRTGSCLIGSDCGHGK